MRPEDLEKIPAKIESIFYDLQNRIMSDVVARIKLTEELSSTSEYLIRKLQMFGGTSEYLESEIKRLTNMTDQELINIFDEVITQDYMGFESIYKKTGVPFIPYEVNRMAQSWTKAILKQTKDEIENITQSLGFMVDYGTKKVFTPLSEYYHKYLDKACMEVVTGTYSYETVLKKVVKEMTTSGMRTVDYATGYSSRATVAARRAVLTGAHQMSAKINEQTAKDLNTDTYEVTWHSGHRPDHWWGGKVYTHRELVDTCGLGTVTGLCGANCRHSYYAFIPGISVRTYTDSQLAEMEQRESVQQTWNGKSYTTYEVTQKQRQMETQMRKQRSDIELLKSGSGNKDDIMAAQGRYINMLRKYQGFSNKMKIPTQMERVYIDGLGRVTPGRTIYKLKDSSDKWKKEARRMLKKDEKSLASREKEMAVVYSKDGKFMFQKAGTEKEILFTKGEVKKMAGCVVSHNHPSGGSFSVADIRLFRVSDMSELRAVTNSNTYFLRRNGKWPAEILEDEDLVIEYKKIRKQVKKKYQKLYDDGKIDARERFLLSSDEYNRVFAETYGFIYGKE